MMRVLALLFLFIGSVTYAQASALRDSTTIVKNQPDSVTRKVILLLLEASDFTEEQPAEALQNYRKALNLTKVKDARWEADIRLAMGKLLYRLKSKDAMTQFMKADALYRKKSYSKGLAETLLEIAKIQQARGLSASALANYNEVYRLQNKLGEAVLAGNAALHATDIFIKQQNYVEAFKYADMAKNAYYKVCRKDSLGSIYYRIASIKKRVKAPKSAEYYILNQALPYYRSSDDLHGRLKSFDFLGQLYKEEKRYSEAKWFYLQANNQARVMNDTVALINSLINLGVTKIYIGDLVLAKQDITEADLIAQSDSVYLPIMKKAKIKYASLFKKLDPPPVIALNEVNKKSSTTVKKKASTDLDSIEVSKKQVTGAKAKSQEEISSGEAKKKTATTVKAKTKEVITSPEIKKKPATPVKPKSQDDKSATATKVVPAKKPLIATKIKDNVAAKKPAPVKAKAEEPEPASEEEEIEPEISPKEAKEKRSSTYIFP